MEIHRQSIHVAGIYQRGLVARIGVIESKTIHDHRCLHIHRVIARPASRLWLRGVRQKRQRRVVAVVGAALQNVITAVAARGQKRHDEGK